MITVAELIGLLQQFEGGCRVVIRGYEGGVCDITAPTKIELDLNVNDEEQDWFLGPHEETEGGSPAVLIGKAKRSEIK